MLAINTLMGKHFGNSRLLLCRVNILMKGNKSVMVLPEVFRSQGEREYSRIHSKLFSW